MRSKTKSIIVYATLLITGFYFLFKGLVLAKGFLAPVAVAALFCMVILPVANWLEKKGIKRAWATFLSDLLVLVFFIAVGWVVSVQIKSVADDWPRLKEKIEVKVTSMTRFLEDKTGMAFTESTSTSHKTSTAPADADSPEKNTAGSKNQPQSFRLGSLFSGNSFLSSSSGLAVSFFSFFGTFLLVFIYVFFFLNYREKFKDSLLMMVPDQKRDQTRKMISESADIAQNYLFGRLVLICILAILYTIGLMVSGVEQAILVSILAAVLTLIPYIGNIIGFSIAVGLALVSGTGLMGVLGVTITFAIAQFVESYILEPYIVGDKVNLNPVFTILAVVLGGAVWGIVGMLIAIPALAIVKVICDNITSLQPIGYLFGNEDIEENKSNE